MKAKNPPAALNRPKPMEWPEYEALLQREWNVLLEGSGGSGEALFQRFLEQHPCMVPRGEGHHGPSYHGVVAQPELPGFTRRFPDFMWITFDSLTAYPTLIEIETPMKVWFRADGAPRHEFTQAHDQLRGWKAWFDSPEHQLLFRGAYRVRRRHFYGHSLSPRYVLVYGRRAEAMAGHDASGRRLRMQAQDERLMTFDRLRPDRELLSCITVRVTPEGARAVSVPPTFELDAINMGELRFVEDLEQAIRANPLIKDERKEFLAERLPLWRASMEESDRGPWDLSVRD